MPRYTFGPFSLDPEARMLLRDGQPMPMAGKTFDMLVVLVQNRGRLVDKDELLTRVWAGTIVEESSLSRSIFSVRKILGDSPKDPRYIATVAGRGYQFVAPVAELTSETPQTAAAVRETPQESGSDSVIIASRVTPNKKAAMGSVAVVVALVTLAWLLLRRPATSPPVQPTHRQITFVGDATFPAISPDGKFVAYVTGKEGHEQRLMLQDLKGGQTIELLKAPSLRRPRWSPDGSELAVPRLLGLDGVGVFLIPRLGGSSRLLAKAVFGSWSPDGSQIALSSPGERGFRIVDKATGSSKTVPLNGFQWFLDLDWSPVANLLAILTRLENGRNAIWTVHLDGTQQRKVIEDEVAIDSPRWSASGDGIYFLRSNKDNTQELSKVSINPKSGEGKDPPSVLLSGLQLGDYLTVSRDGMGLACSRVQYYSNLWQAEFQGQNKGKEPQTRPLTSGTSTHHSFSISPDGKWIAFITGAKPNIYKMPIDGGPSIQLTFSDAILNSTAWSPDGKRIAFGSNSGGAYKVWIVNADGGNLRQLARTQLSSDGCGYSITWSPGRYILYEKEGNRNFNILDPETGEEKPLVHDDSIGWMFSARYSPDGKKVAVLWNRPPAQGLWAISLIDNSAILLTASHEDLFPAGWSPDGRSIYACCVAGGNILLSTPAGGRRPGTALKFPGGLTIPF